MGAVAPFALTAIQALQTAGTVVGAVNEGIKAFDNSDEKQSQLSLQQLQAQQNAELRNLTAKAALDKQEIQASADEAEAQRQAALKRAVARQRAEFGASGIDARGGSSEAVLLGLFEETEEEKANRERLDNLRVQALDQNIANTNAINTLQRTQLQQRSKFENSTGDLDTFSKILNIF